MVRVDCFFSTYKTQVFFNKCTFISYSNKKKSVFLSIFLGFTALITVDSESVNFCMLPINIIIITKRFFTDTRHTVGNNDTCQAGASAK